jgi:hypothetical protein
MKGHKYCKSSSIIAQKQCVEIWITNEWLERLCQEQLYEFIKGDMWRLQIVLQEKKLWWKYKNNKPQSHKGSSSIVAWMQYIKRWTTSAWTFKSNASRDDNVNREAKRNLKTAKCIANKKNCNKVEVWTYKEHHVKFY